jgi:hypothetical protein
MVWLHQTGSDEVGSHCGEGRWAGGTMEVPAEKHEGEGELDGRRSHQPVPPDRHRCHRRRSSDLNSQSAISSQ